MSDTVSNEEAYFANLSGDGWDKRMFPDDSGKGVNNAKRNKGTPEQIVRITDFRWQNQNFTEDESKQVYRELYDWIPEDLLLIPSNFPNAEQTCNFYLRETDYTYEDWKDVNGDTAPVPVLFPEDFTSLDLDEMGQQAGHSGV